MPDVPVACRHERGHITDSRFYGHAYATAASRRIFCDVCRMQRWLDVEAALALSQAEVGLLNVQVAGEIATAARLEHIDLEAVSEGIRSTGHSLVSLLGALQAACRSGAGEFIHYGATTQDIQDTAQALEMRDVLDEVGVGLYAMVTRLVELGRAHRNTLMVGRTHGQPALPTTFGLKVAGWIDELVRQAERLEGMRARVLVVQLFGGVGTMAGFGESGPELLRRFAIRLELGVPALAWHATRDRVCEYVFTLAMVTASLARIADEVRTLSRPEFDEVAESWEHGEVGSSTMPHKRNPEGCEQVLVLAKLARATALVGLDGMIQEHERDGRGLRVEWVSVADASHHTLAALAVLGPILAGLEVHDGVMARHARQAADKICSEALMLALGRHVGKQTAHTLVYEASQAAQEQRRSLRLVLSEGGEIAGSLPAGELERIFDPAQHLGSAGALVDEVTAHAESWLAGRPGSGGPAHGPGMTTGPRVRVEAG